MLLVTNYTITLNSIIQLLHIKSKVLIFTFKKVFTMIEIDKIFVVKSSYSFTDSKDFADLTLETIDFPHVGLEDLTFLASK